MGSEVGRQETEAEKSKKPKTGFINNDRSLYGKFVFFRLLASVFYPLQQGFYQNNSRPQTKN